MDSPAKEITAVLSAAQQEELLVKVGQLTRNLHESLRELGLDKILQRVASDDIPSTRDRLAYVAKMTEQAAQRVLNATDAALPLQEGIESGAGGLAPAWQDLLAKSGDSVVAVADPALIRRTADYLQQTQSAASQTRSHLMDIMMAQDFQDLTGQVIRKVTELGHSLESQLVQLLIDYAPQDGRRDSSSLLNGPQINPAAGVDIVADQGQVDDLLESLGF